MERDTLNPETLTDDQITIEWGLAYGIGAPAVGSQVEAQTLSDLPKPSPAELEQIRAERRHTYFA